MGVRLLKELVAYQLAQAFKREVYRLIDNSEGASRHFKFKDQLRDSASGIARNATMLNPSASPNMVSSKAMAVD